MQINFFFHQGGDISPFPENNNPGESFQTGSSEERAGEGHQEDGKLITMDALKTVNN